MDVEAKIQGVSPSPAAESRTRELLLEEVHARVARYLGKLCRGNSDAVEELSQETMVRLVRSYDRLRDPAQLVPWAFRIATNVWRDERRRRRAVRAPRPGPSSGPAAWAAEQRDLVARLLEQPQRLPEPYRVALTLRYL